VLALNSKDKNNKSCIKEKIILRGATNLERTSEW
jgi:hypothetical protein